MKHRFTAEIGDGTRFVIAGYNLDHASQLALDTASGALGIDFSDNTLALTVEHASDCPTCKEGA